MVICLERGADLHMAQLMLLPLNVSDFSKIQIGFNFLVPGNPGSPRQRVIKRVCRNKNAVLTTDFNYTNCILLYTGEAGLSFINSIFTCQATCKVLPFYHNIYNAPLSLNYVRNYVCLCINIMLYIFMKSFRSLTISGMSILLEILLDILKQYTKFAVEQFLY